EHCMRAIRKGATKGPHGLPLMGGGDWNDGMNRVGIGGRGESVWLAWFLYAVFEEFRPFCGIMSEPDHADDLEKRAVELREAIEEHAWDGGWYLRAFYDSGNPMGSRKSRACEIDSIAQSWSVLSGAGREDRARQAMEAIQERLVNEEDHLMLLFTPPFDRKTAADPGYIKAYPPGIRENGGQYTHAAIWTAWACSKLGQGRRAEALFRLLNPIYHADTPEKVAIYRVEPYVLAADIYSRAPYVGRGGWTWYTGSGAWFYRLGLEAILGLRREGEKLLIDPCIPDNWPGYVMHYHFGGALYRISINNDSGEGRGVSEIRLDNEVQGDHAIRLRDDAHEHQVQVILGGTAKAAGQPEEGAESGTRRS
ncbi:hypothetical protein HQ520_07190, partial [bacterium]|nr:hypothetical protein [bacterium]